MSFLSRTSISGLCAAFLIAMGCLGAARADVGLFAETVSPDSAFVRNAGEAGKTLWFSGVSLSTKDMKPAVYSDVSTEEVEALEAGSL